MFVGEDLPSGYKHQHIPSTYNGFSFHVRNPLASGQNQLLTTSSRQYLRSIPAHVRASHLTLNSADAHQCRWHGITSLRSLTCAIKVKKQNTVRRGSEAATSGSPDLQQPRLLTSEQISSQLDDIAMPSFVTIVLSSALGQPVVRRLCCRQHGVQQQQQPTSSHNIIHISVE